MTQRAHLKTLARPVPGPPRCRVMRWTESVGSIDQVSRQPVAGHGGRRYVPVSKWRYALDPPSAKGVGSGPERRSNVAVTRQMRPHGHSIASSTWPVISPGVSSPHSQWTVVEERWISTSGSRTMGRIVIVCRTTGLIEGKPSWLRSPLDQPRSQISTHACRASVVHIA
jgi:hypothetical protein